MTSNDLARDLEQAPELRLRHELCVLRAKRSRQHLEPARVLGRVAGQLLRVELARGDDQVIDRLLGLDAEHDRGVAELQVEVEEERLAPLELRAGGGEVGGGDRLAGPALRREDRHDLAVPAGAGVVMPAGRVRRLADREDDVLDELRQQQDVRDVRIQSLLEQPRRAARREQEDRGTRVLPDCRKLVRGQRRGPGCMEDGVQVAARQGRSAVGDVGARPDEFDLGMAGKRVAELVEPFTGSGGVDAHALGCLGSGAHYGLLPGPSKNIVSTS